MKILYSFFLCLLFKYIGRKKSSFSSFTHLHRKDGLKHFLQHYSVLPMVEKEVADSLKGVEDSSEEEVVDNSKEVEDSSEEVEDSSEEVEDSSEVVVVDNSKEVEDSSLVMIVAADNLMVEAVHWDEGYDSMRIELHLLFE
jgi:hypothetical protein